jgi:hypothetical protein
MFLWMILDKINMFSIIKILSTQIMKTKINDYIGEILIFVNLTWWEVGGDNTGGPGVRFKLGG